MNILFVSCEYNLFDKVDCGAANRSTMFVKALSQIAHVDVVFFGKETLHSNVPDCDIIFNSFVKSPSPKGLKQYCLRFQFLFRPFSPYGYYQSDISREKIVDKLYSLKKYDYVACRYIVDAVSCGLLKFSDQLILDVDDSLTKIFKQSSKRKDWSLVGRMEILLKSLFVGKMCRNLLKQVDCSFYSNITESPYKYSVFLHNVPLISQKLPIIKENTPKRILFIGQLDYPPNKNGIIHFLNNIYPLIRAIVPDVEFHIIGKSDNSNLIRFIESNDGVSYMGYVENILKEYAECRVVVVPIYQGAGSCVKFVEGLFANRPLVSTSVGSRGFNIVCLPNIHFKQADSDREFADATIELLNSVEKANTMAQLAYEVGQQNFSQQRFGEIVKESVLATK